jgi:hypothetical protein
MPDKKLTSAKKDKPPHRKGDSAPATDLIPNHPSTEEAEAQKREAEREEQKKVAAQRARKRRRRIKTQKRLQVWTPIILSALVFFVTSVYTFFSYRQWQTMEKSLEVTQEANLVVSDIRADFDTGKIHVWLDNIGHVPAKDVKVIVTISRTTGEVKVERSAYQFQPSLGVLPPSSYKQLIEVPLSRLPKFSPEDAQLIRTGEQSLTMFIGLVYDNGFKPAAERYPVFFLFEYVPPPNERWDNRMVKVESSETPEIQLEKTN